MVFKTLDSPYIVAFGSSIYNNIYEKLWKILFIKESDSSTTEI